MSESPRRVVYTALFGRHERLVEQPLAMTTEVDFLCFTDDPELRSETWELRLVEPLLALDPVRSARAVKLVGHAELAAYDEVLWVDARVRLDGPPDELLDSWLADADLAAPRHSFRTDVVSEFEAVLEGGLDDFSRIYEQLTHYSVTAPELLRAQVPWTGMLARRPSEEMDAAMRTWLVHALRYSRRDQLSFVHCMALNDQSYRLVATGNHRSEAHEWLAPVGRSARPWLAQISDSLRPPVAELGELRLQLARQTEEMVGAVAAREARIAELESSVAAARREVDEALEKVAQLRTRLRARRTSP
jgi:hypothetical protein